MRKRIDRFIEDTLVEFNDWFIEADWIGKERDAVNLFTMGFLAKNVQPDAAIHDLRQIRIEVGIAQLPDHRVKKAVGKDLTIWKDPLQTTWDIDYQPVNVPWVVLEWKFQRGGKKKDLFDEYDTMWVSEFTRHNEGTFGYLVQLYDCIDGKGLSWAKVKKGEIRRANTRS